MPPLPNDEHQELVWALCFPLYEVVQTPGLGKVRPGVNVSDRHPNWQFNFRGPDVVVYLNSNHAINHDTHWTGGPDFLVEIISPGEAPYAKFDSYAAVNMREVLVVDRDPWAVELFQLKNGKMALIGRSDLTNPAEPASSVLPLTFKLIPSPSRPLVELRNNTTGKVWVA